MHSFANNKQLYLIKEPDHQGGGYIVQFQKLHSGFCDFTLTLQLMQYKKDVRWSEKLENKA